MELSHPVGHTPRRASCSSINEGQADPPLDPRVDDATCPEIPLKSMWMATSISLRWSLMLVDATLMMRRWRWYHLPEASSTYMVAAAAKEKMRSTSGLDVKPSICGGLTC